MMSICGVWMPRCPTSPTAAPELIHKAGAFSYSPVRAQLNIKSEHASEASSWCPDLYHATTHCESPMHAIKTLPLAQHVLTAFVAYMSTCMPAKLTCNSVWPHTCRRNAVARRTLGAAEGRVGSVSLTGGAWEPRKVSLRGVREIRNIVSSIPFTRSSDVFQAH